MGSMAPSQFFLENGADLMVASLINKLDDNEFAGVITLADNWTDADFDAALHGGIGARRLPEGHASVNSVVQRPSSLPTSQIQLARLKSAWKRAQGQKAIWNQMGFSETPVSPASSTLDLQQQDVILGQWGWQVVPRAQPKHGTARSSS